MKSINNPIIFLPGIMGSMGDEIIPGTGKWSFGVARWIYDPFIRGLEKLGYEINRDLFICYYDWRRSNIDSAKDYLLPMINKVKEQYKNSKIDIICHSMGGLVARAYIQSYYYKKDINRFIMIGTPNKGAIDAYYFWSQGDFINTRNDKKNLQQLMFIGYIWLLQKLMNFSLGYKYLKEIHELFPSISELLPSYDYGPCLCFKNGDDLITIPMFYIKYRNTFLNRLNQWSNLITIGCQSAYCIVGNDNSTGKYLQVEEANFFMLTKEDIIDVIYAEDGDGTVISHSAKVDGLSYFTLNSNHHRIVYDSLKPIYEIYNNKHIITEMLEEIEDYNYVHILIEGRANLIIRSKDTNEIILQIIYEKTYSRYEYIEEYFDTLYRWIILKNIPNGGYLIDIEEYENTIIKAMILTEHYEREYQSLVEKNKTLEIQVF